MASTILRNPLVFFLLLNVMNAKCQYPTELVISDIQNNVLKEKIQNNSSRLLTELNMAFFENRKPNLDRNIITPNAIQSLLLLWETSSFRCYEQKLIEKPISRTNTFEIRNIPLFFKEADDGKNYEEGVIVFNSNGLIEDFFISVGSNRVNEILRAAKDVTDFRRRQIVLDFVENFRTSYNKKDIIFLEKVFSDNALIITGKIVKVKQNTGDFLSNNFKDKEFIQYSRQTKSEYINRMSKVFKANNYINIKFEEIIISQHLLYPEVYGVTVKQFWNTTNYSDVGYVFLMIDFKDEDNPIIHVRTWQPEKFQNRTLSKDEVFGLGQFGNLNRQ